MEIRYRSAAFIQKRFKKFYRAKQKERHAFVVKIVSYFRSYNSTTKFQDIRTLQKSETSIIKIQAFTRGVLTRLKMNDLLHRDGGPLILWKYHAQSVFIFGDFTIPPYEV